MYCVAIYELIVTYLDSGTVILPADSVKYIQIANRVITWQNDHPSLSPPGLYKIELKATITEFGGVAVDQTNSFNINIKHWCWLVQFYNPPIETVEYYIKDT